MKRLYLLSTLVLFMAVILPQNVKAQVSVWDGTYAPWTNGSGTETDPFLIESAQQLAYLAYRVNNGLDAAGGHVSNHDLHYKLMIDVDLNGSETFQWTPIGYFYSSTNNYSFGGHFDGNKHTISGLYITRNTINPDKRIGFFGFTDGAIINNLSISGDTVLVGYAGGYVGGIIGYANATKIEYCSNNSPVYSASNWNAGGIVGYLNCTEIVNCYNTGNIYNASGIAGRSQNSLSTITNSYNIGNIIDGGGGIYYCPAANTAPPIITNCFYLDSCGGANLSGGSPMSSVVMRTPEFVGMLNNGSCAWEQDLPPYVNDGYPVLTMIKDSAYTELATDLTATSATLHGSITVEHATITSKGFEYRVLGYSTFTSVNVTNNDDTFF